MTGLPSLISPSTLRELCTAASWAPPGAIVEIGVYQGGSALALYQVAQEQARALYLYDTFAGHPYHDDVRDHALHPLGRFADAADPDALRAMMPGAVVVVGIFPESLVPMPPVAFVHADTDIYESTRAICERMPPLMVPGGVLWFDDYSQHETQGCRMAVDEAFSGVRVLQSGQGVVVLP